MKKEEKWSSDQLVSSNTAAATDPAPAPPVAEGMAQVAEGMAPAADNQMHG